MRKRRWNLFVVLVCSVPCLFLVSQYALDQRSITWRDYMKVKEGMARSEIEQVLGPPHRVDVGRVGGTEVRWIGRNKGMIYVEFDEQGMMARKYFIEEARDHSFSFFPRVRE